MLPSRRCRDDGHELPATLRRSCREAQNALTQAHDRAVQARGGGDQADRAAFTTQKEKSGKRGDQWIAKRDPAD